MAKCEDITGCKQLGTNNAGYVALRNSPAAEELNLWRGDAWLMHEPDVTGLRRQRAALDRPR